MWDDNPCVTPSDHRQSRSAELITMVPRPLLNEAPDPACTRFAAVTNALFVDDASITNIRRYRRHCKHGADKVVQQSKNEYLCNGRVSPLGLASVVFSGQQRTVEVKGVGSVAAAGGSPRSVEQYATKEYQQRLLLDAVQHFGNLQRQQQRQHASKYPST